MHCDKCLINVSLGFLFRTGFRPSQSPGGAKEAREQEKRKQWEYRGILKYGEGVKSNIWNENYSCPLALI